MDINTTTQLPRVTIQFCTQCKWMLRAAYFAQELLSTFSTSLGEVALQPSTGGIFIVHLYTAAPSTADEPVKIQQHLLWDRKAEGGFPETKQLKRLVRDIIEPSRDLGHVDGHSSTTNTTAAATPEPSFTPPSASTANPSQPPIPRAINRLLSGSTEASSGGGERKFTPMDVDVKSRPVSPGNGSRGGEGQEGEEKEVLNSRGKVVIGGGSGGDMEGFGFCRPGDEDCG